MSRQNFVITLSVLLVIIGTLIFLNVKQANRKPDWDFCGDLPNKHITWTGAGYNGIYGR